MCHLLRLDQHISTSRLSGFLTHDHAQNDASHHAYAYSRIEMDEYWRLEAFAIQTIHRLDAKSAVPFDGRRVEYEALHLIL
jgi:hypothetical protein